MVGRRSHPPWLGQGHGLRESCWLQGAAGGRSCICWGRWPLVYSPRAGGVVQGWGSPPEVWAGGVLPGPRASLHPRGVLADDMPGAFWDDSGPLATATPEAPSCPDGTGTPGLPTLTCSPCPQTTGAQGARRPPPTTPAAIWRAGAGARRLQQTGWAILLAELCGGSVSLQQCLLGAGVLPISVYVAGWRLSGACACPRRGSLRRSGSGVRETVLPGPRPQPQRCLRGGRGPGSGASWGGSGRRGSSHGIWGWGPRTERAGKPGPRFQFGSVLARLQLAWNVEAGGLPASW